MKVLITGGAGFIGFHLAAKFKKEGHDVVCLDNFNDYYDPLLKKQRAHILEGGYGVQVINVDLAATILDDIFKLHRPHLVVHLAASAGVRVSMDEPLEYIENNIVNTQRVINACEKYDVENVIYASTSCVMGGNQLPWNEHDPIGMQLSPYGYTKATNENQFDISKIPNVAGLRFFTVYGPYGRPDMALFDFTKNILAGNPITVYNNGDMVRDFTYIDDIVQGINLVSKNMTGNPAYHIRSTYERDIYCIGHGAQVQLMDFISAIEKNLNKSAIIEFADMHPADAKHTWSDTTKIQKLGYKSTTSIEEGVEKFIHWYKGHYK